MLTRAWYVVFVTMLAMFAMFDRPVMYDVATY